MSFITKLRKYYNLNNRGSTFWWTTNKCKEISIYCFNFKKWKELKEKGYTDMELVNYFTQWLFWKYPKEMKEIEKIHYKETFDKIIDTRIL